MHLLIQKEKTENIKRAMLKKNVDNLIFSLKIQEYGCIDLYLSANSALT